MGIFTQKAEVINAKKFFYSPVRRAGGHLYLLNMAFTGLVIPYMVEYYYKVE